MKQEAMQFAENYRLEQERLSSRIHETVRHPSLYVLIGSCDEVFDYVRAYTAEVWSGGAFFLRLNDSDERVSPEPVVAECAVTADRVLTDRASASRSIRAVKAEIQRNEFNLNIKRINLSVIVDAASQLSAVTEAYGLLLREIFTEDFPIVHMTLFILLSESNLQEDFEYKQALSFGLLKDVARFQSETDAEGEGKAPVFDLTYLLSDRNEHDIVNDENRRNNYAVIASLTTLTGSESHFEDNLRKRGLETGSSFLVTAGMARLVKPHAEIAYTVFRSVYDYLLADLQDNAARIDPESYPSYTEALTAHAAVLSLSQHFVTDERLVRDILSVATATINAKQWRGRTLADAEQMIFGDGARRFFEANYVHNRPVFDVVSVMDMVEKHIEREDAGPYVITVYENNTLDAAINTLAQQIAQYKQEMEQRYRSACPSGLFVKIDTVKQLIADIYTLRYRIFKLEQTWEAFTAIRDALTVYAQRCRKYIKMLEEAALELSQVEDPGHHITAYYRPVTHRVMAELSAFHGPHFFFTSKGMGSVISLLQSGTETSDIDSTRALTDAIISFINQHVLSHDALRLSFDEDIQQRAMTAPGAYDSEFTNIDEFYRRIMTDADRQAALAVSLQRYDDLIFEKHYLGDINGSCMGYARQLARGMFNESVYFADEPSGFKVIRLAGGFTMEQLTRYRTMVSFYEYCQQVVLQPNVKKEQSL